MLNLPASWRNLLAALILPAFCASAALADKHVVEKVTRRTSPEGEALGAPVKVETWFTSDAVARIDELNGITTIVRKDLKKLYIVLHSQQEVLEINRPFLMPEHLSPLFKEVKMTWGLVSQRESRLIGKWMCKKVELFGRGIISVDIEMWVTPESGVDVAALYIMLNDAFQLSPVYKDLGIQLFSLDPDFRILTTATINRKGITTTTVSEVESISDEPSPRGVYDPPKAYKKRALSFSTYLSLVRDQYTPFPNVPR
jgi:hypothetical protein